MKLTYFFYLQLTILRLIKHFTAIYADANKQFLTLNLIFFAAKKSPYLGPQSPYQKLQISLFEPRKISHVCLGHWKNRWIQTPQRILMDPCIKQAPVLSKRFWIIPWPLAYNRLELDCIRKIIHFWYTFGWKWIVFVTIWDCRTHVRHRSSGPIRISKFL